MQATEYAVKDKLSTILKEVFSEVEPQKLPNPDYRTIIISVAASTITSVTIISLAFYCFFHVF